KFFRVFGNDIFQIVAYDVDCIVVRGAEIAFALDSRVLPKLELRRHLFTIELQSEPRFVESEILQHPSLLFASTQIGDHIFGSDTLYGIKKVVNFSGISVILPGGNHLPGVPVCSDLNQFIAIMDCEALNVRAGHPNNMSRSFPAFPRTLGPTVETENEGAHRDRNDQQNKRGFGLHDISAPSCLPWRCLRSPSRRPILNATILPLSTRRYTTGDGAPRR